MDETGQNVQIFDEVLFFKLLYARETDSGMRAFETRRRRRGGERGRESMREEEDRGGKEREGE